MASCGQVVDVDVAVLVDLEERQHGPVESAALEQGELVDALHDGIGVLGDTEDEVEQRNAADGTLFDHPGDGSGEAFFDQDMRDEGRDPEAEVDGLTGTQFLGRAASNDLLEGEGEGRGPSGPAQLTGEGRVVAGLGGLQLVGRDDERVDEDAGHADRSRDQAAALGEAFDLGDHDAAVVVGGVGKVQRAQR